MATPKIKAVASAGPCTTVSNKAAKQHITVTKVNQAADCLTDHKLLVSKCLFSLKQRKKSMRPPKRLDTCLDEHKIAKLEEFLDENLSTCAADFEELKVVLQNAATCVFGKKKMIQNDWFDDQDEEIQIVLHQSKCCLQSHI